jgi:mycothiol synthase
MMTNNALPKEYRVRAPTLNDQEPVIELIAVCDMAEFGEVEYTADDLQSDWHTPGFDLKTDAWLITGANGTPAGYAFVWNKEETQLQALAFVHPQHYGRGIGTYLVRLTEDRALRKADDAPPGTSIILRNTICNSNADARRLLEKAGYRPVRHFWRMRIYMDEAPPQPGWPAGISVRTFIDGQDERATFEAMEDAFRDHWGYTPWRYDVWESKSIKRDDFDPSVWFLAMAGDEIVGGSLCRTYPNEGWVGQLAVGRPRRRRGQGQAQLQHTFGEFYRRGMRRVSLGVDAQNTTGATRLYERAGMQMVHQFDSYEKVLRPRQESSIQPGDGQPHAQSIPACVEETS